MGGSRRWCLDVGLSRLWALASYLAPVVAVVLGWVILHERIGWLGLLGMTIVVAGVALAAGWDAPLVLSARRAIRRG